MQEGSTNLQSCDDEPVRQDGEKDVLIKSILSQHSTRGPAEELSESRRETASTVCDYCFLVGASLSATLVCYSSHGWAKG